MIHLIAVKPLGIRLSRGLTMSRLSHGGSMNGSYKSAISSVVIFLLIAEYFYKDYDSISFSVECIRYK